MNKTYIKEAEKVTKQHWGNKTTQPDFMVFDNFYENGMHMRAWALNEEFTTEGNYPGIRTQKYPYEHWATHFEVLMNIKINRELWSEDVNQGAFQSVQRDARTTWVHADTKVKYTAIVYLNPYAPPNSGTSFYEHRETGSRYYDEDSKELNEISTEHCPENIIGSRDDVWRKVDTVSNKFNRCVVFRGNLWHAADDYFGWDLESSRLTQTFWFDEED